METGILTGKEHGRGRCKFWHHYFHRNNCTHCRYCWWKETQETCRKGVLPTGGESLCRRNPQLQSEFWAAARPPAAPARSLPRETLSTVRRTWHATCKCKRKCLHCSFLKCAFLESPEILRHERLKKFFLQYLGVYSRRTCWYKAYFLFSVSSKFIEIDVVSQVTGWQLIGQNYSRRRRRNKIVLSHIYSTVEWNLVSVRVTWLFLWLRVK